MWTLDSGLIVFDEGEAEQMAKSEDQASRIFAKVRWLPPEVICHPDAFVNVRRSTND